MESRTYIIGRSRTCDIQVDDPTVSGRHAELIVIGDDMHLMDLGSTNGTFILRSKGFEPYKEGYVSAKQKVAFGHFVCSITQLLEMANNADMTHETKILQMKARAS